MGCVPSLYFPEFRPAGAISSIPGRAPHSSGHTGTVEVETCRERTNRETRNAPSVSLTAEVGIFCQVRGILKRISTAARITPPQHGNSVTIRRRQLPSASPMWFVQLAQTWLHEFLCLIFGADSEVHPAAHLLGQRTEFFAPEGLT